MLNVMRRHLKKLNWILWIVILSFVMTIFLVWGMDADRGAVSSSNVVAEVDGAPITLQRYNDTRRAISEQYRSMFGDRFEEFQGQIDIDGQAYGSLVEGLLIRHEAERLGIAISDTAVQAEIGAIPAFQENNRFSPELYRARLDAMRRRPGDFEESVREDLQAQRIRGIVQGVATVSEQEVLDQYRLRNEQVSVDAIVLTQKDFEKDVVLTPEMKKAYYDEHKTEFQIPETVQVEYVLADRNQLMAKIEPTAEEIAADYEKNKEARYRQGEGVRARHILFAFDEGATDEQKKAAQTKAQSLFEEIAKGRDFIEAANALTEDPSGKGNGGDLGWFERGAMVPEFDEKVFSMKPGEISPPVLTSFGYHIIKVEERREAGFQQFATVAPQITVALKQTKASEAAQKAAETARAEMQAGKSTEEAAKTAGAEFGKTGFFSVTDPINDLIRDPALNRAVFALQPGNVSDLIPSAQGMFVFKLLERKAPHQGELEEVDVKLSETLRVQKSAELIKARADQIKIELATIPLGEIAKKYSLTLDATPELKRNGFVVGPGRLPEAAEATLFASEVNTVLGPIQIPQGFTFVRLTAKKAADNADLEATKKSIEQELLSQKKEAIYRSWLTQLRAKATIRENPLLQRMRSQGRDEQQY